MSQSTRRGDGAWRRLGRYARVLAAPLILWALVIIGLREPIRTWLRGESGYDQAALQEWLLEARAFRETLPEMADAYCQRRRLRDDLLNQPAPTDPGEAASLLERQEKARQAAAVKREEIHEQLRALGVPPTKMFAGQLPLFPVIYRLEVRFDDEAESPVVWDSGLPSEFARQQELDFRLSPHASARIRYQLHASSKQQRIEQENARRVWQLGSLALAATGLAIVWLFVVQQRESRREQQRALAEAQVAQAERLLSDEERRRVEIERKLLEQQLATQAAERQALELKSQLYASIGIMAGSYAHNIKNLLVRPNDLLRRCLEASGGKGEQATMLHEVQQTLGTVTERLQQILRTVRRDPTRTEATLLDLNEVVRDLHQTWRELASEKWKLDLRIEPCPEPLRVAADLSHLQQAAENLLFNARDATFEMRNRLRDEARRTDGDAEQRKRALITAAGWRGQVQLRTRRVGDRAELEIADNGIGMSDEVRRRCTETHFSTKRDNALYEGHAAGMGLGLAFVTAILEHHGAELTIESTPLKGATFRVRFPLAAEPAGDVKPPAVSGVN